MTYRSPVRQWFPAGNWRVPMGTEVIRYTSVLSGTVVIMVGRNYPKVNGLSLT